MDLWKTIDMNEPLCIFFPSNVYISRRPNEAILFRAACLQSEDSGIEEVNGESNVCFQFDQITSRCRTRFLDFNFDSFFSIAENRCKGLILLR